jgi:hypothetical protein
VDLGIGLILWAHKDSPLTVLKGRIGAMGEIVPEKSMIGLIGPKDSEHNFDPFVCFIASSN